MQRFYSSPLAMMTSVCRNKYLIKTTAIREVQGRYRGSLMGIVWSLLTPLFMLTVYTFVFSGIFKAKWHGGSASRGEFALVLFAGLIVFNFFAECLNKAPQIIIGNVNYVKKVVYPLEILPVVSLLSALFQLVISLFVWLAAYCVFFGIPHLTVFYFPLVLVPLMLITLGISWFLAAMGVFLRDISQFIGLLTTALHNHNQQTEHLVSTLMAKDDVITHLNQTLLLKEQALVEQLNTIQQLNGQLNSRLIRLRSVAAQPFSLRKVLHMNYLMTSLVTPRHLRHYLAPFITRLRVRFAKRPVASVAADGQPEQTKQGHQVLVPQVKENAPRIVHVIANFMTGGSSRLVVDLIEYLGAEYKQSIITSYIPDPPAYLGVDIEECRFPEDTMPFIEYYRRLKPDFIHVHYWGDVDEPWYAKAIEAARELNIPVIENINTPIAPHLSPAVKRYVYVSDYVRHVFGQSNDSHVTVYPGSDFSHFMRADEEAEPQDCVGMVYRLEGDKLNEAAIEPFIRIVQKRPQTKILIVGGGSLLAPFQQAVKEAGVEDNFEFTGYVEYSTLPEYYRRMSLFVAPVWKESFGQVSPFAMNMRVPVIGYDIGAIREIVNSKAMLAPAGDADKLADIAITLLDDEARRAELGKEHQQRAEGNFSIQAMIDAYDHLYADMIKK